MSLSTFLYGNDPMDKQTTKDLFNYQGTPYTSMDQTDYSAHAAAPEQTYQQDQKTWQDMRNDNAPMYGRSVSGYRDEADNASQGGAMMGARYQNRGDNNLGTMQGIANTAYGRGAGLQGDSNSAYGMAGQDRQATLGALGRLQSFYQQGPGPSAAEAQMRAGNDANMANSIALARSGRGNGGNAMAMRQAQFGNAAADQQMNQQLGVLRANESANWRQQQMGAMGLEQQALGGMRGADINQGAQLGQQALGYGGLGNQAMQGGMQNQLGYSGLASNSYQSGQDLRNRILGGQQNADTARYGADRGVQVGMANVGQREDASNLAFAGSLLGALSDVRAKKDISPQSFEDYIRLLGLGALQGGAQGAVQGGRAKEMGLGALQGGAQGAVQGGAPTYDLRPAQGYSYDYKNPSAVGATGGRQFGPMAQDLEKTPVGASVVKQGPDGQKMVDTNRLTMVNTAALSEQQRHLDYLDKLLSDRQRAAPGETLPGPTEPQSIIGWNQSGDTGLAAMQRGPYGLPTQEEADAKRRRMMLQGSQQ